MNAMNASAPSQFLEKGFDVLAVEASSALVRSASRRPVVSAALASGQLRVVNKAISRVSSGHQSSIRP